jgi:hypothetical protein
MAFIYADGQPVPTAELMRWCYSGHKLKRWHWHHMARAARRFGVLVHKGLGRRMTS